LPEDAPKPDDRAEMVVGLFMGTFPAAAEIIALTCVETVAGASNSGASAESVRIDTSKLEITVLEPGRAAYHYGNTIVHSKLDPAISTSKTVAVTGDTVIWTSATDLPDWSFRAEYDRATHRC
jgi:hypothetical protein